MSSRLVKEILLTILSEQRVQSQKSLEFYLDLEAKVSTDEQWKYHKISNMYDSLWELVPPDPQPASAILRTSIATIDTYTKAIQKFSDNELAAFVLGLGLNWIPFRYWGRQQLETYLVKIEDTLGYYRDLLGRVPTNEQWKYQKTAAYEEFPDAVPPKVIDPPEILLRYQQLNASILQLLQQQSGI